MLAPYDAHSKRKKYIWDNAMPDQKGFGIVKSIVVLYKNNIVRSADPPIVRLMEWSCLSPDFRAMVMMEKAIKKQSIL